MDVSVFYFELLISESNSRISERYEYALYSSLTLHQLCDALLDVLLETYIRDQVLKHISIKLERGQQLEKSFEKSLVGVFETESCNRKISRSLGTVFIRFMNYFSNETLKQVFNSFINSDSTLERNRASQIAERVFDSDIEEKIWRSWRSSKDKCLLRVLSQKSTSELMIRHFDEIWNSDDIPFKLKNLALKKVAVKNLESLKFLESESPTAYLTACVAASCNVSDDFLEVAARKSKTLAELSYIIWCAGQLGKSELLIKLMQDSEKIESGIPKSANELMLEAIRAI